MIGPSTAPVPRTVGTRTKAALHRKRTWFIGVPLALVAITMGGAFAYVHQLNANVPAPLSFANAAGAPAGSDQAAAPAANAPAAAGAPAAAAAPAANAPAAAGAPAAAAPASTTAAVAAGTGTTTARKPAAQQPAATQSPVDGTWGIVSSSVAGYRMAYDSPMGSGTRVGRTNAVTGQMTVKGSTVTTASFAVDFRKVECDAGATCTQHTQQIMDVANHPFENFVLTSPIDLGSVPADGKTITASISGKLTLRGVTRSVTFPLQARRSGSQIQVLGSIKVNRDDYKIPDSGEPGFTIAKNGTIELLLAFQRRG